MLGFLLLAQLAVTTSRADSTYSSAALERAVSMAARSNHLPPASLQGYTSHIESEIGIMLRDTLGREHTAEVEQLAATGTWDRGGRYAFHVIGYRAQSIGVPYSALSIVRAWTVPTLYGERLRLGVYSSTSRDRDTVVAVHPFAADRALYYRFSGGDMVAVLRAGARRIPIMRVRVHPQVEGTTRLAAFDGEIDLDAERWQIIRMRGRFVILGAAPSRTEAIATRLGLVSVAYVEFVNAEINGSYWLPAFQRTEFQASIPFLGQARPIIRIVSQISNITVAESREPRASADTVEHPRVTASWAPRDSLDAFNEWRHEIGRLNGSVSASDFDDVAPDIWRADGPPRLNLLPHSTARVARFNRVEGLFTGIAPSVDFRNAAPGLTVGAAAGWAWSEQTARGGGFLSYQRGSNTFGARAERALVSTNDFTLPLADDPGFAALLSSIDNYDYVDRRTALLSLTRMLGTVDDGLLTVQAGVAADASERARLSRGLFGGGTRFLGNRASADGHYALAMADLELHPDVTGDFVQPGVGAHLHYEGAHGQLRWQRVDLSLSARRFIGPVSLAAHVDGGIVLGDHPPPQTLYELGGEGLLPGYSYKQFAGDRAALFRTFASYRFHRWEQPIRIRANIVLPSLSPGIAMGAQGGWTAISSPGAASAVQALGGNWSATPVSTATDGIRATVGAGITLFSDVVHLGVARPVDRAARWKLVFGFGSVF